MPNSGMMGVGMLVYLFWPIAVLFIVALVYFGVTC